MEPICYFITSALTLVGVGLGIARTTPQRRQQQQSLDLGGAGGVYSLSSSNSMNAGRRVTPPLQGGLRQVEEALDTVATALSPEEEQDAYAYHRHFSSIGKTAAAKKGDPVDLVGPLAQWKLLEEGRSKYFR